MEMLGKIKRMYFRDKLSLHDISKRTGLSRNTLRKWLRSPIAEATAPTYERKARPHKLSAFIATLETALTADAHRTKQNRRTGKDLLLQIQQEGYQGSYSRITDFIRGWRDQRGKMPHAFVPLKFELGEAFQFDWSEESIVIGGVFRRLQVSHMKLCASRAFWLVAYPSQGHEMLFDAHTRSFAALGGVCRRGIYDNMKTAVDKVNKGKGRIVNARFAVMCAHYLFDPDFCNVASGWEKGVVEKNVQDSRRRIWLDAQNRQFSCLADLNAWLSERCRALWSELRHPEYPRLSVAEMLTQEQAEMMPMPTPFDGYVEHPARVSSTCLVRVNRNRYSVPCEFAGDLVSTRLYPTHIHVVANDRIVATHARLPLRDEVCYDWQHYIPLLQRKPGALRNGAPFADLPAPLMQLKRALMRHIGGDKVMAQVLAVVPVVGLEAVLAAVELALETGLISGEHILNLLSRLTAKAVPASVETSLALQEEPEANTERYDRLRSRGTGINATTAVEAHHA